MPLKRIFPQHSFPHVNPGKGSSSFYHSKTSHLRHFLGLRWGDLPRHLSFASVHPPEGYLYSIAGAESDGASGGSRILSRRDGDNIFRSVDFPQSVSRESASSPRSSACRGRLSLASCMCDKLWRFLRRVFECCVKSIGITYMRWKLCIQVFRSIFF